MPVDWLDQLSLPGMLWLQYAVLRQFCPLQGILFGMLLYINRHPLLKNNLYSLKILYFCAIF